METLKHRFENNTQKKSWSDRRKKNFLFSKSTIITIMLMGLILCGCSNKQKGSSTSEDNATKKFIPVKESVWDFSGYEGLLGELAYGVGEFCTYSMYDIDNDGVREAILKVGTSEDNYQYHFYCLDEQLAPIEMGIINASNSILYANEEREGLLQVFGYQGQQTISELKVVDGKIVATLIEESTVKDENYYGNSSRLSECYVSDLSLLQKDAKLVGEGLKVQVDLSPTQKEKFGDTLSVTMERIGMDFELFDKKESNIIMEADAINIHHFPVKLKNTQKLYLVGDNRHFIIVENNVVVGYMCSMGSPAHMKKYFPTDDCYDIQPQKAKNESFSYCCWKTENCYLLLGGTNAWDVSEEAYYDWTTFQYILLKDLSQCTLEF